MNLNATFTVSNSLFPNIEIGMQQKGHKRTRCKHEPENHSPIVSTWKSYRRMRSARVACSEHNPKAIWQFVCEKWELRLAVAFWKMFFKPEPSNCSYNKFMKITATMWGKTEINALVFYVAIQLACFPLDAQLHRNTRTNNQNKCLHVFVVPSTNPLFS